MEEIIEKIVQQLKSQGIFDQFRRECMSDVDTKPAYQNLRQRVDGSVSTFLSSHQWGQDLNKKQLRDNLRKYIQNSAFLEAGVERIVDQVVNPKICPVFLPQVEEVVYDCLGVNKPGSSLPKIAEPTPRMDSNIKMRNKPVNVNTSTTKPQPLNELKNIIDLEPVSPASVASSLFKTSKSESDHDVSVDNEEEEASPPFEPHTDGNIDDNLPEQVQIEGSGFSPFKSKGDSSTSESDRNGIESMDKDDYKNPESVDPISSSYSDDTSSNVSKATCYDDKNYVSNQTSSKEGSSNTDIDNGSEGSSSLHINKIEYMSASNDGEIYKSEAKRKHKHSSNKQEKKYESKISKDHHSYHKHGDRRLNSNASKSNKVDKYSEDIRSSHKQVNIKNYECGYQKSKNKNNVKYENKISTRDKIKESQSVSTNKKDDSESKKEHRRSHKLYKKSENSSDEKYSGKYLPLPNVKDSKKSAERHHVSKTKYHKQKCSGNEKQKERRRSNDRDSDGQEKGSSVTDYSSQTYFSHTTSTSEKDNSSPSSNDNIVTDSGDNFVIKDSNDMKSDCTTRKKIMIYKKKSNLYEIKKKNQARKSLERIHKNRRISDRTGHTKRYLKCTTSKVDTTKVDKEVFIRNSDAFITLDAEDEVVCISDESLSDRTIKETNLDSLTTPTKENQNSFDMTGKKSKTKFEKKIHPSFIRGKLNEKVIDQENEPDYITINSSDESFVSSINTDSDLNLVPSKRFNEKKSLKRSQDSNKSHKPIKKMKNSEGYSSVTTDKQIPTVIITKIKNSRPKSDRTNKVLKAINQDVKIDAKNLEPELEKELKSSPYIEEDWCSSQATGMDSPSKLFKPKLSKEIVTNALQDLLKESGLTTAYPKESEKQNSTPSLNRGKSSRKKIKSLDKLAHQHYDKSDLYKPRPQFTNSSKRSRRHDANSTTHDDTCRR